MTIAPESEQEVFFAANSLMLEGRLHLASTPNAVIITHPHPLYGGDFEHPVVITLTAVYQQQGYTTLRFNFRGVGASTGDYAEGRGEQEDVRAAAAYLAGLGKTVTDLAGYSFGSWINLHLEPPLATVRRQLAVSPPVALLPFTPVASLPELQVIVGDRDEFAPLALLRERLPLWRADAQLTILPGVDHFYWNGLTPLAAAVEALLVQPG
jgi:alpha/beta superfamily hydrolase